MKKSRRPRVCPAFAGGRRPELRPEVLFAVYAPFGGDRELTTMVGRKLATIDQHPLLPRLKAVAKEGVNVAALIDLVDSDTWLVEIPAWHPERMYKVSAWKQAMNQPEALAGFLRRAHDRFRCRHLVLSLEGHGAGYLPEIDVERLGKQVTSTSTGANVSWTVAGQGASVSQTSPPPPVLGQGGYAELPVNSPVGIPASLPISTWALARALDLATKDRRCRVPRPRVIHFNNCFNMALEHLSAVAPFADVATGYANYNYFTAGISYPELFQRLRTDGPVTPEVFGRWIAEANHKPLEAIAFHPGVGAAVRMSTLKNLVAAVERLARKLTTELDTNRAASFPKVKQSIADALQFDSGGDFKLEVPDQATDLGTWMVQLKTRFAGHPHIPDAAEAVRRLIDGLQVYGDKGPSKLDTDVEWDFSDPLTAISITIPDPGVTGVGDWRAPYYMAGVVDPARPPALKAQIPFLAHRGNPSSQAPWPEFLDQYHRGGDGNVVPILTLLPAPPFVFPTFDPKFTPTKDPDPSQQTPGQTPGYGLVPDPRRG
jgi:hypothetical protein